MAQLYRLVTGALLALILAAACDSTSPESDRLLHVRGDVLEAGQAPAPPVVVEIQAWPAPGPDGSDLATLHTDAAGVYTADLGPFPTSVIDSLRVRVTQNDCGSQLTTDLRRRDLALDGEVLVLPTLALSYRLPSAQVGIGGEACAAIVTPASAEIVGDYARLALWIDDVSDSVRGRWRLNHSASIGDDSGYFSGSLESDHIMLQLQPTLPTPCTGLQLTLPVGGDNGATMGAGELTGDGSCSVPSTTVRFFEGAVLTEDGLEGLRARLTTVSAEPEPIGGWHPSQCCAPTRHTAAGAGS